MQSTVVMCIIGAFLGGGLGMLHTVSDSAPAGSLANKRLVRDLSGASPDSPSSTVTPFSKAGRMPLLRHTRPGITT